MLIYILNILNPNHHCVSSESCKLFDIFNNSLAISIITLFLYNSIIAFGYCYDINLFNIYVILKYMSDWQRYLYNTLVSMYFIDYQLYNQTFILLLFDTSIEFRVIKLQNGLTALLIADIHSKTCVSQDESDQEEGKYLKSSNYVNITKKLVI